MAKVKDLNERDFRLISNDTSIPAQELNFNKIRIANEIFKNDVSLNLNSLKLNNRKMNRDRIEKAIQNKDTVNLRAISNLFYRTNGIYSRLCRYMAYLYRYDWFVTPLVFDKKINSNKVLEGWYKSSSLLENCRLKKLFGDIALKVILNGAYYGYKIQQKNAGYIQELPSNYCRSRFSLNGKPIIEFNIKFFDDNFADNNYRIKVVKMFPKEFQKAYLSYKKGTLPIDFQGDEKGWFPLDPNYAIKFNLSGDDFPLFVSIIPALMDLDDAQDLDKKKMEQQILKIIVQKLPLDKDFDMVFSPQEAADIHTNAVTMLSEAIGVDVLTTFADVQVEDMADTGNVSSVDQLEKVERTVYNEAGVSQLQFNSDKNIALEKSIANDEATMSDLLYQFEEYAESLLKPFNKNEKRLLYRVSILPTTVYNYKDLAKLYKEQTMIGFSKLLPQVALGLPQSVIISTAYFENELMNLDELFIPPQMSSTISAKQEEAGRQELDDDKKQSKTIENIEAGG